MEGHFFKRGCTCDSGNCKCNKKWTYVIDVGINPKNGKRKQKTKGGFKTEHEAQIAAEVYLAKIKNGVSIENAEIQFKDFTQDWLTYYIDRNAPKPGSIDNRQYSINKLMPYFAFQKVKDVTKDSYQEALNDLKSQHLSGSTLEGIHTTGKMIFNFAKSEKILNENPTTYAFIKKDQKTIIDDGEEVPNFFEKDELLLFIDTIQEKRLYMDDLIFTILAYTGMRVGELVSLKWKDIDIINHTISITKTYYNKKNNTITYKLIPPKTHKSRRKIPVAELVIEKLREHKKVQEKVITCYGNSYRDEGFIFANINRYPSYPILLKLIQNRMTRLLKLGGVNTELTPHSLRHTHTSLLAQAGATLEEIMIRLGHCNAETTRKVYLHVTNEVKRATSDKFSKLLQS